MIESYDRGVLIKDLASMVVDRRIEEATTLYTEGWSLAKLGNRYGGTRRLFVMPS
jgi:hypothetical protein